MNKQRITPEDLRRYEHLVWIGLLAYWIVATGIMTIICYVI